MSERQPSLVVAALVVRYPGQATAALRDVSFEVAAGERVLLLGPNGAGKSTCLRAVAGLTRPTSGHVAVLGTQPREARQGVGVVGHQTLLYEELTATENLRLFGALYGVAGAEARAATLLAEVGLAHRADVPVGELSRGQQQRVALARALLHDPPLLLLDEPDTGLDAAALGVLERLLAASPRAALISTHDVQAGARLAQRALVLARGRLVDDVPVRDAADVAVLAERLRALAMGG